MAAAANDVVWGLNGTQWSVVASIAQALAALGAIALLYLTWAAQRDSRDSVASAQRLASATDSLVLASAAQQELAVVPVIEVMAQPGDRRLRMLNKGNGPLIAPRVTVGGVSVAVVAEEPTSRGFGQTGALAAGNAAYAQLADAIGAGDVVIRGSTLTGSSYEGLLAYAELGGLTSVVARQVPST